MNITLVAINVDKNATTSLAIAYLISYAVQDKEIRSRCRFTVKNYHITEDENYILLDILRTRPRLVGFSTYLWNIQLCLRLSRKLKKIMPRVKIVFGGPEIEPDNLEKLSHAPIDFLVMGEGEEPFYKLCRALLKESRYEHGVDGLIYNDNGVIRWNGARAFLRDISLLPSPFLTLRPSHQRHIFWETMRGCTYHCSFCNYNKNSSYVRFFPLRRLEKELEYFEEKKFRHVYIVDPTFNVIPSRTKAILKMIAQRNPSTKYHVEMRAELLDDETMDLLKKAGVEYIELGLQSVNRTTMKRMNRYTDLERFRDIVNQLNRRGLYFEVQLILGLPGDDYVAFKKSIDYVISLNPPAVSIFNLQLIAGSDFRKNRHIHKITFEENPPYTIRSCDTFSSRELLKGKKLSDIVTMLYPYARATMLMLSTLTKKPPSAILELLVRYSAEEGEGNLNLTDEESFLGYFLGFAEKELNGCVSKKLLKETLRYDIYCARVKHCEIVEPNELPYSLSSQKLRETCLVFNRNVIAETFSVDIEELLNGSINEETANKTCGFLFYRTHRGTRIAKVSAGLVSLLKKSNGSKTVEEMITEYARQTRKPRKKILTPLSSFFKEALKEGILY
jgi:radical SAM superfamily enzyme YgiQ (UPF0313 family)